jgi:hypothetical protein
MRFAYADPPYLGQARHYPQHPDSAIWDKEQAHADLIAQLVAEYPDGWALSCSTPSLRVLLPICPADIRIGAWVKPFHAFKRGVRPAYAWEPMLYRGGRNTGHQPPEKGGTATTPRDWIAENITLRRGLVGAKPEAVCRWVLDLLGYQPGDRLDDLFPGSDAMARVLAQDVLPLGAPA